MKKLTKIIGFALAAFAFCGAFGCGKKEAVKGDNIYVYAPDGAPALSLAKMLSEDKKNDGVTYEIVNASTINTYVTYNEDFGSRNADVCILPLASASKFLADGEHYKLVGAVTHGNLYMISAKEDAAYTVDNLDGLIGKTVGVVSLAGAPGLTLKMILKDADVPFTVLGDGGKVDANKVNLQAVEAAKIAPTDKADVFIVPEPAASVKVKNGFKFVGDLQALYGGLLGEDGQKGYPQAVLVMKNELIEDEPAFVKDFIAKMKTCAEWLKTAEISTVCNAIKAHLAEGLTPSLSEKNLTKDAITRSSVSFLEAYANRSYIESYVDELMMLDDSYSILMDEFYYQTK